MNDIVKYDNYMNDLKLKKFTSTDIDFLMMLCAKMKNMGTKEMNFSFIEIKKLTNYKITSNKKFVDDLERMNKKLMEVTCRIETEKKIIMFVLFPTFEINKETSTLIVSVNEKFSFILNELTKDFTRFELEEFVSLKSKYSKNLYRILKQFRSTGQVIITNIEDFKGKLDCPKSYEQKYFMLKVINPAIEELKEYFPDLECTKKIAKRKGNPTIGYTFTFTPEKRYEKKESEVHSKDSQKKIVKKPGNNKFNNFPSRSYSERYFELLEKSNIFGLSEEERKEFDRERMSANNQRELTPEEKKEYERLTRNCEQMEMIK